MIYGSGGFSVDIMCIPLPSDKKTSLAIQDHKIQILLAIYVAT